MNADASVSLSSNEALQRIEARLDASPAARRRWDAAIPIRDAILAELDKLATGPVARTALLVYEALSAGCEFSEVELAAFGSEVAELVEGQRAAEKVWSLHAARNGAGAAEGLRRLLLAIIRDLRVVFILLARQLVMMRRAGALDDDERRAIAQLTADIHAPLANRLGIWQLKWELEDLAFRYLQPETYRRIADLLDERRGDRETWIAHACGMLQKALADAGIRAEVAGRPKHISSIWRKMQKKGLDFSDLYDIRALRVLVGDVPSCYAALGVVHSLWPFIAGEFDDYIASPKGNNYQSLHTAVIGPEGRALEVQIRSHDMHAYAELGFAAHWRYKEGSGGDASFERKIAWMRQLLESRDEHDDDAALLAGFRTDVIEDRVYLLTPRGQVLDLPKGATVLDFAYLVHTDVGHRCRGAKVNGRIVPLTFQPGSGDRIEILTAKNAEPSRDWLSAQHGFLQTARARNKVRNWFRQADREINIAAGRGVLDRELKRLALHNVDLDSLPARFHLRSAEDLYEAIALGDVTPTQIARNLHDGERNEDAQIPRTAPTSKSSAPARDALVIEGVGNLLSVLARCCQPVPGDAVTGFITRGRGVSVHRSDCRQLQRLRLLDADRIIEVEWGGGKQRAYEVDVLVRGYDRKGLHKDVSNVIAAANVQILAIDARVDPARNEVTMNLALRVADFGQLSSLLAQLHAVPNVIEAQRKA
ncbi:MAG: bifunctional (p)ppGpp synthetase/guanosine-3',5'-bis(diphosphate) 3'-pyrophosphohydrolase [Dokdonella sp.]|uniref:RelA/SpoT family protein n=1 Tax=Dokdonella sp. TaxID=2291710 RepID=UPI002C190548|nr:bifunctional (p)ppGpp synthetase/guanosine-3',5'-bis(diphosphate) 3'-pyrophosphohydrolase [Xanthomonadales bacterium]MBL0222472.1 bifunctional (p)ppGpp synthetase/guanosine-3',5'-bis(diphosphate) 3'-pyrophosphohydrolase [Xanthomonadales bacterium]HQW75745.1 bifunctional (p)ppGpp synthetase/guanosine-3',5'-bis(diphosphate) 3'-pyrophosphohydrolase [Dokdonella sp.]HQZ61811.1 bifunctional (p)ppGpp synthetase/guanosine-3',5'-bis(diphosphate) 3'-pyrophosphohydrolase [Dokdonella sp.]